MELSESLHGQPTLNLTNLTQATHQSRPKSIVIPKLVICAILTLLPAYLPSHPNTPKRLTSSRPRSPLLST